MGIAIPSRTTVAHAGCVLAAFAVALAFVPARQASARPLYAARTGMACARCHLDPAGGGMRNGTGFTFALNGHTTTPVEERETKLDPSIADGIRLGGDFRTQYLQDVKNEPRDRSSFFLMQSTLYVSAELTERVTLYYANDQGTTLETFGLIGGLPLQGTVKIGRFRPAFGLEEEDHTTFTRDPLGFGNSAAETGVELSLSQSRSYLVMSVLNGNRGDGPFDDNKQKAAVARAWTYGERAGLGLNGYVNNPGLGDLGGKRRYIYGAFGNLHVGPFVFLGEYDRGANQYAASNREAPLDSEGEVRTKVEFEAGFAEVTMRPADRFTLRLKYDRFDPDLDYAETARDRIGVSLETDLFPFTRLLTFARGMREYGTKSGGTRNYGSTRDTYELLAQLHLGF